MPAALQTCIANSEVDGPGRPPGAFTLEQPKLALRFSRSFALLKLESSSELEKWGLEGGERKSRCEARRSALHPGSVS